MAQGNLTWQRGDITGDIYFDYLRPLNQDPIPYVRLYLMIDGSPESKPEGITSAGLWHPG